MKAKDQKVIDILNDQARKYVTGYPLRSWTMDMLAASCGITKRTLYKMVSGKEQVVEQVILGMITECQRGVKLIIDQGNRFQETLVQLMEQFPVIISRVYTRQFQDIYREYPGIEQRVIDRRGILIEDLTQFLALGVEKGVLKAGCDPALVVELLQGIVLYQLKLNLPEPLLQKRLKSGISCILYGILDQK